MSVHYEKTTRWIIAVLLISMVFGSACSGVNSPPDGKEIENNPQPTITEAIEEENQSSSEDGAEEDLPTPQTPAHMASGLVLSSPNETFYVDVNGEIIPLIDQPHAHLNSTHNQVVFAREDPTNYKYDIWLLDLESRQEFNLTQTPDRDDDRPQWWPAHPEIVFFESGKETGMMNERWPTIINLDGSGYRILDENNGGPKALAADGGMIAYGGFDQTGIIYHWSGDIEVFNPGDYGLNVEKIFQPSLSADGRYLAWKVAGDLNEDGNDAIGLAIFDLQERTAIVTHIYTVQGGGMVPHYVTWSPDGSWIAYVTFGEEPAVGREPNLWILRPDGSQETYIDIGLEPTWSPDGSSLAYVRTTLEGEIGLRIMDVDSLTVTPIDDLPFPDRVNFIMDWIQP